MAGGRWATSAAPSTTSTAIRPGYCSAPATATTQRLRRHHRSRRVRRPARGSGSRVLNYGGLQRIRLNCLARRAKRIDELQAGEVLFVISHDDATVNFGYRGYDHVERASWPAFCGAFSHQPRPDQPRLFVEREDASREECLWSLWTREPSFQQRAFFSFGLFQHSALDFSNGQRGDEQVIVGLFLHPREKGSGGIRSRDIADDVGVEQIARHRSTLRPVSCERVRSRSAPTSGERRNAARMPPFFGGSPPIVRVTAARIRAASGSSSASRFASDRIRSRSASRPKTSNRAMPRLVSRVR